MRLLELFGGTGSVGEAFRAHVYEVVSLEKDSSFKPTIREDILARDYTCYPTQHIDVVWASPECTQYSIARSNAKTPRNLDYADALVQRALEIIKYFNPRAWYIENPASGLLKTRQVMHLLPCVEVSYCKWPPVSQTHHALGHCDPLQIQTQVPRRLRRDGRQMPRRLGPEGRQGRMEE